MHSSSRLILDHHSVVSYTAVGVLYDLHSKCYVIYYFIACNQFSIRLLYLLLDSHESPEARFRNHAVYGKNAGAENLRIRILRSGLGAA